MERVLIIQLIITVTIKIKVVIFRSGPQLYMDCYQEHGIPHSEYDIFNFNSDSDYLLYY